MKINLLNVAKVTTVKIFLDIKVYTECKTWCIDHRKCFRVIPPTDKLNLSQTHCLMHKP